MNGIYAPGEEPLFENVGTSIIFKLPNGPGTLASALKCLEGIDLMHIESKPDNRGSFEFYAETGTIFWPSFGNLTKVNANSVRYNMILSNTSR